MYPTLEALGYVAISYDGDSLSAVLPFVGKPRRKKYVRSKVEFNPRDEFETGL